MIYTKIGKQITIYDKIGPKLVVIVEQGISKELPGQNKIKEMGKFLKSNHLELMCTYGELCDYLTISDINSVLNLVPSPVKIGTRPLPAKTQEVIPGRVPTKNPRPRLKYLILPGII